MKNLIFILIATILSCNNETNLKPQDVSLYPLLVNHQIPDEIFDILKKSYSKMDTSKIRYYNRPNNATLRYAKERERYTIFSLDSLNEIQSNLIKYLDNRVEGVTHMATHFIYYDGTIEMIKKYLENNEKEFLNSRVSVAIEFLKQSSTHPDSLERIELGSGHCVFNLGSVCPQACNIIQ